MSRLILFIHKMAAIVVPGDILFRRDGGHANLQAQQIVVSMWA